MILPKISGLPRQKRRPFIEKARFFLLFFAVLNSYQLPSAYGKYFQMLFDFAIPVFFILSGYFVLRDDESRDERILRTIHRTAILFIILFFSYLLFSFLISSQTTATLLKSKKFWFDFLVLNEWKLPCGGTIWYIQALLYAYIVIFFLQKFHWLRYDLPIIIFCLLFATLFGEFSGLFHFNILGHTYISGNWLTRALPYLLIGGWIHQKRPVLNSFGNIAYIVLFAGGLFVFLLEFYILKETGIFGYYAHFIGTVAMSFAIAVLILLAPFKDYNNQFEFTFFNNGTRFIYIIFSPIYTIIFLLLKNSGDVDFLNEIYGWLGIIAYIFAVVCYLLGILFMKNLHNYFKDQPKS